MIEAKRAIYKDCGKIMAIPVVISTAETVLTNIIFVYISKILGEFADAVFLLDYNYGLENIWILLTCIILSVVVLPLFRLFGNVLMLKKTLVHDRAIMSRFLEKKYQNAMELGVGDIEYRLENDPNELRIYWIMLTTKYITVPVTICYLLFYAMGISALYTIIVFILSGIKLIVPIAMNKRSAKNDWHTREYNTAFRDLELNIIQKPYIVKMFSLKAPFLKKLNELFRVYFEDVGVRSIRYKRFTDETSSLLDNLCTVLVLLVGAILVANGSIGVGSIAAMIGYFTIFGSILNDIGYIVRNTPIIKNIAERMIWFYTDIEDTSGNEIIHISKIVAVDLSFSYPGTPVFQNINFDISGNEKIAICGENGSGKSTLTKILWGLLGNYTGSIKINDIELNQISVTSLRKMISYVPQNPYLFEGSNIKENIRLGNLNAHDEEIEIVMNDLGISHLADRTVTANQSEFSGGERQRISLAKAIVKNPKLLIMDEPSNNLDKDGLKWLKDFIDSYNAPLIFVTHNSLMQELANDCIKIGKHL